MMMEDILKFLREKDCKTFLTGSVAICNPPPTDTDTDYLVYTGMSTDETDGLIGQLIEMGFKQEGDGESYEMLVDSSFVSLRRGALNLIVTNQIWFRDRHCAATGICKALNLMNKADRIMVFKGVLYNELPDFTPTTNPVKK